MEVVGAANQVNQSGSTAVPRASAESLYTGWGAVLYVFGRQPFGEQEAGSVERLT